MMEYSGSCFSWSCAPDCFRANNTGQPMSSSSSHSGMAPSKVPPLFSLAPCVAINTPPPPVVLAMQWRSMYPAHGNPFVGKSIALPPFIDVAQGVPSGLPPQALLDRFASEERKQQHHSYRSAPTELADALALRMNETYRNGKQNGPGALTREDISITAGCNMASETAFRMIAQPGGNDAIVLTTPYYFNHSMQLSALNIATAYLPTSAPDFYPDPQAFRDLLQRHRDSQTTRDPLPAIKGIALVTPNNPTGSIYPPALISEFAQICKDEKIALILDETYREFLVSHSNTQQLVQPHSLFEDTLEGDKQWDWRSTVIHLYSFSKSFAIPGHRLGALVCHPILKSITPFQGHDEQKQYGPLTTLLDNSLIVPPRYDTQMALSWALNDVEQVDHRRAVAASLIERFKVLRDAFEIPISAAEYTKWGLDPLDEDASLSARELGWRIVCYGGRATASEDAPQGGYFVFVKHPFSPISASNVSQALSTLVGVGTIPEDFFLPHAQTSIQTQHLRLSLANVKDVNDLAQVPVRMALLSSMWHSRGTKDFGTEGN